MPPCTGNRYYAAPPLAGALSHQLLDPGGHRGYRAPPAKRQLVLTVAGGRPDADAEFPGLRLVHGQRALEYRRTRATHQGEREHADDGQSRISPADIGWMREHFAPMLAARLVFQWCARIGDGDEMAGRGETGKVVAGRHRLDGRTGLAGNEVEGLRRIRRVFGRTNGGRIRAVQDGEVLRAEARGEHPGRETRSPHAAHDGVREAVGPRAGGEFGEARPFTQGLAGSLAPAPAIRIRSCHRGGR